MESPEHEREFIQDYMAGQAPDEDLFHLEKVASERVMGRDRERPRISKRSGCTAGRA